MNQEALANLVALGEGFTTEFKRPTAQVAVFCEEPRLGSEREGVL